MCGLSLSSNHESVVESNRMIIYSAHVRMRQSYYTYDEERDACTRRWILRDISDAYLHSHNFLEIKNLGKILTRASGDVDVLRHMIFVAFFA